MSKVKNNNVDFLIENTNSGDILNIESINILGNSIYDITKVLKKADSKRIALLISGDIYLDFRGENEQSNNVIKLLDSICNIQRDRLKNSIQNAIDNGKSLGRAKLTPSKIPDVFWENLHRYETRDLNKTEFAKVCNCSRPTLDRWFECIKNSK